MERIWKQRLLASAVLLSLAGCGGSKAAAPAPVTVSATLGPAGGALGVTGADGSRFDLVVPAGALAASTALTLTAEPPLPGQRFHVVLGPPGLAFRLGAPATLTIALAGAALPATGGLAVDGAAVPFTRGAGGALSLPLRATAALAAPLRRAVPAPGRALTPATCGTPTVSSTGVTGANTVDLALYAACMQAAVDQLDATGLFEDAVQASLSVAALLQRIGGNGAGDAQTFLDAATTTACRARGAAFSLAAGVTITDVGEVFTLMRPMAYWEAVTQGLGASCGGQATFSDAGGALTTKALERYQANRPQVQDPASAAYHGAVVEAQDARQVSGEVAAMQPPAAVTSEVDAQVKDRAERTLVDELLDGPWTACHASGDDQPLLALMAELGSPDAARDVAQYCSVSVTAEAFSAAPTVASLGSAGPLGDTAHGTRATRGAVKAALTGTLRLAGTARALTCPAGMDSPEALVLALNGHEVRRLTDPSYLGNPIELDLPTALATAGLDPAHPPATLLLTLTRDGAGCSGYWGANPSPLLTFDLAPSDQIAFSCSAPTSPSGWDLCTVNPDGGGLRHLVVDGAGPAWSHDRTRIAFDLGSALTLVSPDGSGPVTLPLPAGVTASSLSWSPDDARLVFTEVGPSGPPTACFIGADGSGHQCLSYLTFVHNTDGSYPSGLNPEPHWSPDGARLLVDVVTYQGLGPPKNYASVTDLFIVDLGGGGGINLTNNTGAVRSTSGQWSPDGALIAYVREDTAAHTVDVYVTTPSGGVGSRITSSGLALHPTWSPDGTQIAYADLGTSNVMIINADGSGVPRVLAPGSTPAW